MTKKQAQKIDARIGRLLAKPRRTFKEQAMLEYQTTRLVNFLLGKINDIAVEFTADYNEAAKSAGIDVVDLKDHINEIGEAAGEKILQTLREDCPNAFFALQFLAVAQ